MNPNQAKKLKELEKENMRLKTLVVELSLDNAIMKEVFPPIPDKSGQSLKRVVLSKKSARPGGVKRLSKCHQRSGEDHCVERLLTGGPPPGIHRSRAHYRL